MGQNGKSVGGMSSNCEEKFTPTQWGRGEQKLHSWATSELEDSWVQTLGPSCFRLNCGNMRSALGWNQAGREMLLLSQALSLLGSCLSQHLLLPSTELSESCSPPVSSCQPGLLLLSQQTSRRQRCLGTQGLPLGSSFAPTPRNQAEGTTHCLPGRAALSLSSLPTTHTPFPPTARAGQ